MITLTVVSGPDKGRKHQLPDDQALLIGRRHGDVPLDDRAVSKEHARLAPGNLGTWIVSDMGSANGTWVNGRRIDRPMQLNIGDKLQIGRSVLTFKHVPGAAPASAAVVAPHHPTSDDTHHTAEALHHALELQQEHTGAMQEIRRHLKEVAQELKEAKQSSAPALKGAAADDWAASARSAIAAEIGAAVAELGRRLDGIERGIQQAADTVQSHPPQAAQAPQPNEADAQLTAAVSELRQSMRQLPAQLDVRPALQQVLAAVERLTPAQPPDHAADFKALREAIAAAADQSQQQQILQQVLAAVTNIKLAEIPTPVIPTPPNVPDHRAELASLREAIDALGRQIPQPVDHGPQLAAIHASLSDTAAQAALEQKLTDLTEAVRFAGDHRGVLEAIDTLRGTVANMPAPPEAIDPRPQLQQVLDAVAALKDPSLTARLDELLARPAAEQGVSEALHALRTAVESAPKPIDPTPALTQQLAELREVLAGRIDAVASASLAASAADQPLLTQILEAITAPHPPQTDPAIVAQLDAMQEKIAGIPAVDIAPVESQIAQLASHLSTQLDAIKPQPDPRLDQLLQAIEAVRTVIAAPPVPVAPVISTAPLEEKLEAIQAALTQQQGDRDLAALLAAAQQEAAAAAKSDGLIEAMLAELNVKLDTLRPEAAQHTLTQILTEIRTRPDPDVTVRTALLELRTSIEQRVATGPPGMAIDDATAKQAALAAAQASIRPVIDMLHEIATEMSHWPKRQERVLGELYAAMRDLQLQQEQHADRLLRLAEHIDTPDRPRRAPGTGSGFGTGLAATSRAEREELADYTETMPRAVAIQRRQPSMMLTVAVVFFIVVMAFMAIAGTTQWL